MRPGTRCLLSRSWSRHGRLRNGSGLRRSLRTRTAAKQATEHASARRLTTGLLKFAFELFDFCSSALERLFLHDHSLRQQIRRIGLRAHIFCNEGFRLSVAHIARSGADTLEQFGEHFAFVGCHLNFLSCSS